MTGDCLLSAGEVSGVWACLVTGWAPGAGSTWRGLLAGVVKKSFGSPDVSTPALPRRSNGVSSTVRCH
jgi:hypothetical protein